MDSINIEFESTLIKLKEILKNIPHVIKNTLPYISEDDIGDLRLIFSELLTNAVIHGNKENPLKKVFLEISANHNYISAKVKDEGKGFNHSTIFNLSSNDCLYDDHGRGLILIRNLADELVFNDTGNEVQFFKQLQYENNTSYIQIRALKGF